jgi:hypothetical protein
LAEDLKHPIRREILLNAASTQLSDTDKILIGLDWLGVILQAANHDRKKRFKPQRLFDVIKSVQENKQNKQAGNYSYETTVIDGQQVTVKLSY